MFSMLSLDKNLNELFAPILQVSGMPSAWFFVAIIFFLLFIIFLIVAIKKSSTIHKLNKQISAQNEYILGLEASSDLPQIKMPEKGEFASIVFESDKEEKKRKKKAAESAKSKDAKQSNFADGNIAKNNQDIEDENELIAQSIDAHVPEINLAKEQAAPELNTDDVAAIVHNIVLQALSNSAEENNSAELKNAEEVKEAIAQARKQAGQSNSSGNNSAKNSSKAEKGTPISDKNSSFTEQEKEVQRILAKILVTNKDNNDPSKGEISDLDKNIPAV
jgi:predicted Holliday junction resolvase-like endonuclease